MSNKSFGIMCDDWMRNNPDYVTDWNYILGDNTFDLKVLPAIRSEDAKEKVAARALIPNEGDVDLKVAAVVLELLKTQVGLYERYGIKV